MSVLPIQPIVNDQDGAPRFRRNEIVKLLLNDGKHDMNSLIGMDFSAEDRRQFAQLIGYSLRGYRELPYADDETVDAAQRLSVLVGAAKREHVGEALEVAIEYQYARLMMEIASERVAAYYNPRIEDALKAKHFELAERLLRKIPCPATAATAAHLMRDAGWKPNTE